MARTRTFRRLIVSRSPNDRASFCFGLKSPLDIIAVGETMKAFRYAILPAVAGLAFAAQTSAEENGDDSTILPTLEVTAR